MRGARMLKMVSRSLSEVGRSPDHVGADTHVDLLLLGVIHVEDRLQLRAIEFSVALDIPINGQARVEVGRVRHDDLEAIVRLDRPLSSRLLEDVTIKTIHEGRERSCHPSGALAQREVEGE